MFVQLLRGNGLLAADANGFSDPYVKLSLGEQKQRSKTMKKTLHPVWTNEVCLSPSHAFFTRLQPSAIHPPSTALLSPILLLAHTASSSPPLHLAPRRSSPSTASSGA